MRDPSGLTVCATNCATPPNPKLKNNFPIPASKTAILSKPSKKMVPNAQHPGTYRRPNMRPHNNRPLPLCPLAFIHPLLCALRVSAASLSSPGAKRTQVRQPSWRGVANERVARSRSSSPDRPRVMRCRPRGRRRSVDRGRCRPAMYSPESVYSPGRRRTFGCAEGHTGRFAMARTGRVRRGRRTRARVKTPREDARRTGVLRPVRCLSSTPGDRSWEISRSAAERQPRPASTIPHQGAPR